MKYIKTTLLLFLFPISVLANNQIDIETNRTNVQLWENFSLTLSLTNINPQEIGAEFSIPGIENFEIFSQSISRNFQNINGVSENLIQLTIQLSTKNTGEFEIGPVELLWTQTYSDDEIITVSVSSPTWNIDTQSQQEIISQENWDITVNKLELNTNNDLRWLREVAFPLWVHGVFILFFLWCFYLLLKYVLSTEKQENQIIATQDSVHWNSEYVEYFRKLSTKIGVLTSEDFFHQYNTWIRNIFAELSDSDTQSATLNELQKNISINTDRKFLIFKRSYKHEYSWIAVSLETQKKYIDDILKLL